MGSFLGALRVKPYLIVKVVCGEEGSDILLPASGDEISLLIVINF